MEGGREGGNGEAYLCLCIYTLTPLPYPLPPSLLPFLPFLQASSSERTLNLGSLFLGVLRFYGHQLNYEEVGLSVLGEGILFRKVREEGGREGWCLRFLWPPTQL